MIRKIDSQGKNWNWGKKGISGEMCRDKTNKITEDQNEKPPI